MKVFKVVEITGEGNSAIVFADDLPDVFDLLVESKQITANAVRVTEIR